MRCREQLALWSLLALALTAFTQPGVAQAGNEFHRTLPVTVADPVNLDVELPQGDLQIAYGREGQVSIAAVAQVATEAKVDDKKLATALSIEQDGNHLKIRHQPGAGQAEGDIRMIYRIDVPYRTEVHSVMDKGKQTITGIMGPVHAVTNRGDIKVSYLSKGLLAEAGSGNLDLQVIGERVEAKTGEGNISCVRVAQGVSAETEDGDITLMVVGPSTATVKTGSGRIDVGGARGSLTGSTQGGDLHVKAVPHDDWQLNSTSGNIRIELPQTAALQVDATTKSGEILIDRDDMHGPDTGVRQFHHRVDAGGIHIAANTDGGKIVIR